MLKFECIRTDTNSQSLGILVNTPLIRTEANSLY